MKYTKLPASPVVADAIALEEGASAQVPFAAMFNSILFDEHIDNDGLRLALLQSGVTVRLDDGQRVWVACAVDDTPPRHLMKFLAVGIALDTKYRDECPVVTFYPLTLDPTTLVERTVDDVRREMMKVVLGEEGDTGLDAQGQAQRSIRTRLKAVSAAVVPVPADVL